MEEEERLALEDNDPVLTGLVESGGELVSLAKKGRACFFHESGRGCTLPYDVRPLLCRRFPIVRDGTRYRVVTGGDCQAAEEAKDLPDLLRLLGVSFDELARIDAQIRSDL